MTPMRPEKIGKRLKRLRRAAGLSQRELAAPGVSYAYISRIEAGTRQPSVRALRKLAATLGVTAEYLEFGADAPAVTVAATVGDIDSAAYRFAGDETLSWDELTSDERAQVTHGLEQALLDSLAARIHAVEVGRRYAGSKR